MGFKGRFSKEWPRLSDWTKEDTAGELVSTRRDDLDSGVDEDADGGKEPSFGVGSRSGTDRVVESALDRTEGGVAGTRFDICVMGSRILVRLADRDGNAVVFCLVALLMEWTSRDT